MPIEQQNTQGIIHIAMTQHDAKTVLSQMEAQTKLSVEQIEIILNKIKNNIDQMMIPLRKQGQSLDIQQSRKLQP